MPNVNNILHETASLLLDIEKAEHRNNLWFPIRDVVDCLRDTKLQSQHNINDAIESYGHKVNHTPEDCLWFWFQSPEWTWKNLCGRAGWMVISKSDLKPIEFYLESMN